MTMAKRRNVTPQRNPASSHVAAVVLSAEIQGKSSEVTSEVSSSRRRSLLSVAAWGLASIGVGVEGGGCSCLLSHCNL